MEGLEKMLLNFISEIRKSLDDIESDPQEEIQSHFFTLSVLAYKLDCFSSSMEKGKTTLDIINNIIDKERKNKIDKLC